MRFALVLLSLLVTLPAWAAEPDWAQPFRKYISATAYLNDIGRSIARLEERLAPSCIQVLGGMQRKELRIIQMPEFIPGLPIPQGGQWQEQVQIDRCGTPALHNILITAVNGASPHMTVLLPGSSKADGRLQVDASAAAFAIAGARAGVDCTSATRHIVDTQFVRWIGNSADRPLSDRVWREIWSVRLCGQVIRVQVDFTPDGKGGFTHRADLPTE